MATMPMMATMMMMMVMMVMMMKMIKLVLMMTTLMITLALNLLWPKTRSRAMGYNITITMTQP
eukprot:1721618-Karenia_brevis.AAC.1